MESAEEQLDDEACFIFASTAIYVGSEKDIKWNDLERDLIVASITAKALNDNSDEEITVLSLWYLILEEKYNFTRVNLDEGLLVIKDEMFELSEIDDSGLPREMVSKVLEDLSLIHI